MSLCSHGGAWVGYSVNIPDILLLQQNIPRRCQATKYKMVNCRQREIIATHAGNLASVFPTRPGWNGASTPETVILNEMVITNPVEQLRGLPGPTEPDYQNKPTTVTCRERGRKAGWWRWEKRGRGRDGSVRQKHNKSEIYFNCEMQSALQIGVCCCTPGPSSIMPAVWGRRGGWLKAPTQSG